jgi:DNA-binding response OmpR family regulator
LAETKVLLFLVDPGAVDWGRDLSVALAQDPGLRAIVLTRGRSVDFDRRAAEVGAHAVLQRPFTVRDLVATLEAVARGENLLEGLSLR